MLQIVQASEKDAPAWDEFVIARKEATPYHLFGWRQAIEEVYGFRPFYLMALDQARKVRGVLPLFEIRRLGGGKAACSIPFCNYAGVIADAAEVEEKLLERVFSLAEQQLWSSVELRSLKPGKHSCTVNLEHVTQVVDLPAEADILWKKLDRKLRWMIRKAEKTGLKVIIDRERVEDFYLVYSENMRDLGTPTHSAHFFRRLLQVFPEQAGLIMLYLEDEPVGGMFVFHFRDLLTDPWASSLRKYFDIFPNYLLYWQAFRHAISLGATRFDLGRSQPGSGTFNFKKKWGALVHQLYYLELVSGPGKFKPKYKRLFLEKLSSLYSHLPLPVSRIVGPGLRRFLP